MDRGIQREKKRITALVIAFFVLCSIFLPAQDVFGAEGYDFQGLSGTTETDKGDRVYNKLKLVEPSDITVQKAEDKEGGYFLNRINDEFDGTAGRIEFAFCMDAGMNNMGEPGNWNFTVKNLDPDPTILPGKETQVNIYRLEEGEFYTGGNWANENQKTAIINYQLGNLKIDDEKTHANITNGDGTGRIVLYTEEELKSGDYILEFGAETCGNNAERILGVPVAFQFTVKGAYTFEEAIDAAKELLASAEIGTEAGQYRDAAKKTNLETCLKEAEALQENPDAEEAEKETATTKLSNAIEAFEQSRIVDIQVDSITGIGSSVSVGSSGTVQAALSAVPNDKSGYRKCTWFASDNIQIDADTGEWTALWAGDAEITAVSKWQSENPSSIPDSSGGKAASKTINLKISSEGDAFSIGIPKGKPDDETKGMLETVMEKAQQDPRTIDRLKIFTARGASLEDNDFVYIKNSFLALKELDLSKASVEKLPAEACKGMEKLETVKLPDRLSEISPNAFRNCAALSDVEISSGVTFIGDSAFSECASLNNKMITIHAVTPPECSEYPGCFNGIEIKGIKVPYGCKDAYAKHKYWKKFVIESDSTEEKMAVTVQRAGELQAAAESALGERSESQIDTLIIKTSGSAVLNYESDIPYLQENFLNATTLDLSDAVLEDQRLKSGTFENRVNLKKIRIHEDTTNIAGEAFYGCKNLRDIILPSGLEQIGDRAFGGCDMLGSSLVLDAVAPPMADGSSFPDCVKTFIVPPQSVSRYKSADEPFWRTYNIISQVALSLSAKSVSLETSAKKSLTAAVKVYNNNVDTVTWTSSNSRVASVSPERGKTTTVTAVKPGTATITAKAANGYVTASCTVTVRSMAAPASAKASALGYNKVRISWSGVSGAQGYILYRSASKSSIGSQIRTLSSSARSYTDTGLNTGKTYYYRVRGYKTVNGTRYLGNYSSAVSAKPILAKATKVKAKRAGTRKVRVSWKKVSGASGYQVYQSTKKNKGFKAVKTIKRAKTVKYTTKKLKKGKRYYFKVRAYRTVGGKKVYSAYSSRVSCKAR